MVCVGHRRGFGAVVNWIPSLRRCHLAGEGLLKTGHVIAQVPVVIELRFGAARQARVIINPDMAPSEVVTVRGTGAWVYQIRTLARAGVKNILLSTIEVITVSFLQLLALHKVAHDAEVPFIEGTAPSQTQPVFSATSISRLRSVGVKAKAVVLAGNHVHDTRDRIRAIHRRGTIFKNFDSIDRHNRHQVEVER